MSDQVRTAKSLQAGNLSSHRPLGLDELGTLEPSERLTDGAEEILLSSWGDDALGGGLARGLGGGVVGDSFFAGASDPSDENNAAGTLFSDVSNPGSALSMPEWRDFSVATSVLADKAGSAGEVLEGTSSTTAVVGLDPDTGALPTLSVNAADPADVKFTIAGLESDYSGTVTFTDAAGQQDVVPIFGSGNYSVNLSNLSDGTLTYVMTASDPAGHTITIDPTITLGSSGYADGAANAAAGTPQVANLLSGYAGRPPWEVAGVDYAVGVPSGMALKDPATMNIAGVTVNNSTHVITVTGNNVTISGYDFSLEGGLWQIVTQAANTTITNCNFSIGSGFTPLTGVIFGTPSSSNLTVSYCTIDGGGNPNSLTQPWNGSTAYAALVVMFGPGATAEYNWFKNSAGQNFDVQGGGSVFFGYNLIENSALVSGTHNNYIQFTGTSTGVTFNNPQIIFNTGLQTGLGGNANNIAGEGFQVDAQDGATIIGAVVSNNTMVSVPQSGGTVPVANSFQLALHQYPGSLNLNTGAIVQDNYLDPTGAYGAFYPLNGADPAQNVTFLNNVNMASGIQFAAQPGASSTNVTQVVSSPPSGIESRGNTILLTLDLDETVTVTGTPTLTLNDGATATYTGGSGTKALTFSYTVGAADSTVSSLAITAVNFPNGATIKDSYGNTPNLSGALVAFSGLQITHLSGPAIASVSESPSGGDLNAGKTVTLTLNLSSAVTVAGGTPSLTLNDGGIATYTGGSGTNALTFSYTVGAGQNTSSLAATAVNLNSATIKDSAGNAANLSLSGLFQLGPQIDTAPPTPPVISSDFPLDSRFVLTGSAENGSTVTIYEGTTALGTTTTGSSGAWAFETPALALGSHTFAARATDAAGNVSGPSALLDPDLVAGPAITAGVIPVGNQVYLFSSSGGSSLLTMNGSPVTVGEFSGWTAIAATQTPTGYDVAWQNTSTGQYTVWSTDSNGNKTASIVGAVAGNSYALEAIEAIFNQDLNGDGTIGLVTTAIQTDGSTTLSQIADRYYSLNSGSGPLSLRYNGAPVTVGEFSGWTPIGAVQTATGYDVAWKLSGTNQYTVWSTDSGGNKTASVMGAVAGNSYALEAIEATFNQDLNGDGTIGLVTAAIRMDGSTTLSQVADEYSLNSGSGPVSLQYNGAPVTVGEFAGWTPIGAVQTATGYDVAWKLPGTNQYTIWSTDSSGNKTASLMGAVAGNSYALEAIEPTFNQDLNGDGTIGLMTTAIQTDGSTTLSQGFNQYFVNSGGGPVSLQYNGAPVTVGEFGGWAPIGAVQTATGYDVAWKLPGANQFTLWSTDSSGNKTASIIGAVAGNNSALETSEPVFNQDLNGDGVIGLFAAPGTTMQISTPLSGASGQATIGAGGTLALGATDSSSVTFAASTGKLMLANPSTFTGEIFGFTGNGTLSGSDQIDLAGMNYNTVQDSYANGVLTVTDGTHTDTLSFSGSYSLANFKFASDGSGGTIVYDPPVGTLDGAGQAGSAASQIEPPVSAAGWSAEASGWAANQLTDGTSLLTNVGLARWGLTDVPQAGVGRDTAPSEDPLGTVASTGLNGVGLLDDAFQAGAQQDMAPQDSLGNAKNTAQASITSLGGYASGPNIALLTGYIAGSFPDAANEQGATPLAGTFQNNQTLLANPHVG